MTFEAVQYLVQDLSKTVCSQNWISG
jgi:hypothetical protein